ncbi:hypothetical protein PG994_003522 [Apiospora phragmitis]|uniref:Secreted protein n=1 Tax=Apiospora phragmitis TaxID=2905665 RepID=A0ABR1W1G0_9PEZI
MARFSLLSILLCALMAMLARGDRGKVDIWSSKCYTGAAIVSQVLTAFCSPKTPMGPPWICSQLNLNHCYAFTSERGIHGKDE